MDRAMWGRLGIDGGGGQKKLKVFLEKGPIRELELRTEEEHMAGLLKTMGGQGSSLEKLDVFVRSPTELG